MPLVEEGVKYPREVEPAAGLPPGWKSIERAFGPNSKCAGQTYIRYESACGKHKNVGSIKKAIQTDAEQKGLDPDKAVRDWEQSVQDEKDAKQKEREDNGFMEGQQLEDAIECFRAKYGPISGAIVCNLPGWRGESKLLENCGQICAMYYSPAGWRYPLVKNIEAMFGRRMLAGLEIPDIEAARNSLKLDENGKPINLARKENVLEVFTHQEEAAEKKSKKRRRYAADEDFHESDLLSVVQLWPDTTLQELAKHGVADVPELNAEVTAILKILQKRGFSSNTQMTYVIGSKKDIAGSCDMVGLLSGVYYQRPDEFNGHPCYQKIALSASNPTAVVCSVLHLFWSAGRSCWKLGKLDDGLAGFARCFESKASPIGLTAKWLVYAS